MLERKYQAQLIKTLREMFPGCIILKNDTEYMQGVPDLTILWHDRWAMLEVKGTKDSPEQANQRFYVESMNDMSFAAFIYPENERKVLDELQQAFRSRRSTRLSLTK